MPGYKTHGLIGAAAGGTVGVTTGEPVLAAVGIVLGALGGLLPDADHPDSWISHKLPPARWVAGLLPGGHRGATHWPTLLVAGWLGVRWVCGAVGWAGPLGTLVDAGAAGYATHLVADALTVEGIPGPLRPGRRLHLLPARLRPSSERGGGAIGASGVVAFLVLWTWLLLHGPLGGSSSGGGPGPGPVSPASPARVSAPSSAPSARGTQRTQRGQRVRGRTRMPGAAGWSWTSNDLINRTLTQPYRTVDRWLTYAAVNGAWIDRHGLARVRQGAAAGQGAGGVLAAVRRMALWVDVGRWPIPAHTAPDAGSAVAREIGPVAWDQRPYATILGLRASGSPLTRETDAILAWEQAGLGLGTLLLGLLGLLVVGLVRAGSGGARTRAKTIVRELPEGARWATREEVMGYAGPALTPFVVGRWVPRVGGGLGAAIGYTRLSGPLLTLPPSVATEGVKVTMPTGEGKSSDVMTGGATLAKRAYDAGGAARCHAPSGIYWDPAGELEAGLAGAYELAGWRVVTLNPAPLDAGARARCARVNPFAWYDGPAWLQMYLSAWFDTGHGSAGGSASQFYADKAKAVIAGLVVGLRAARPERAPTWPEIAEALAARAGEDDKAHQARIETLLVGAGRDGGEGLTTWQKMAGIPAQFTNLKGELGARLAPLQEEAVRHMLSGNDVPLEALVTGRPGPVVLFIQVPSLRQEFYAPVTASLLVALMDAIGTAYLRTGAKGTGLFVELDEAGSGAAGAGKQPIYGLSTMVTTLRKFGCMIRVFYQAGSQVTAGYGGAQADTIGGNLKTWAISGGAVGDAAGIAERCGVRNVGTTTVKTILPTAAERKRGRVGGYRAETRVEEGAEVVNHPELVTPTMVQQLPKWRRMVVGSRGYPFVVQAVHPSQIPAVAAWIGLPRRDPDPGPASAGAGAPAPPVAAAASAPSPPVSAPPPAQGRPAVPAGGPDVGGAPPVPAGAASEDDYW